MTLPQVKPIVDATLILNPTSGGGAGRRLRGEIQRELESRGLALTVEETTGRGDAVRLTKDAVERGAARIIAAGGDGTVHEVVNGILAAEATAGAPAFGVVPVGTGNDYVKLLSGKGRQRAYTAVAGDAIRRLDVGYVEWDGGSEHFVNGMGTGVDVEVVRELERTPRVGAVLTYLIAAGRALLRFRPAGLKLRIDGVETQERPVIVAVGNGVCQGGGFYFWPGARPDDGRLDICIVGDMGWRRIALTLPRILTGSHEGRPGIRTESAEVIDISSGGAPLFFQIDGELRELRHGGDLRVTVLPSALEVLVHPDGKGSAR